MSNVLVSGANRGLGLEMVRQYAEAGWRVFACCRDPGRAPDLELLSERTEGRVSIHQLDVADHGQIEGLAAALRGEAIDVLLNNAGTFGDRGGFGAVDYGRWAEAFRINSMGPLKMAEAFVEHVARSQRRVIANVSSLMGSCGDNESGGSYVYRSSKAALNMVTVSLARDLGRRGIVAVVLHPGWVRTDMGGPEAPLDVTTSVTGMRNVLDMLSPTDTGKFYNYDGEPLPW